LVPLLRKKKLKKMQSSFGPTLLFRNVPNVLLLY
jgi:hypothetical protein